MIAWFAAHLVDILLILAVAAVVGLCVYSMIADKKAGRSSCGGSCSSCSSCAMGGACHRKKAY